MPFDAVETSDIYDDMRASKVFTDRTEPRLAFWKSFFLIEDQIKDFRAGKGKRPQLNVINYYGIGGQGKTAMLARIRKEIAEYSISHDRNRIREEIEFDIEYINDTIPKGRGIPVSFIDLDTLASTRMIEIIYQICRNLSDSGLKFPFVFSAYYRYLDFILNNSEKKRNIEEEDSSIKILDEHPYIAVILEGIVKSSKIAALADAFGGIKKLYDLHRAERLQNQVESLKKVGNVDGIEKLLPDLFESDMRLNLENIKEPMVICLDTYEKFVSFDKGTSDEIQKDSWLRKLVIKNPGVIWIISGRDKLYWNEADKSGIYKNIESHLLGNLSENDVQHYLSSIGIEDEAVCSKFIAISEGVPAYIEFCVDRYYEIKATGKEPVQEDFSTDITQLFTKYKHSIPDPDLIEFLACLGEWDDYTAKTLGGLVLSSFSASSYRAAKRHSYITQIADDYFRMHGVIETNFYDTCDRDIKEKTLKFACDHYADEIKKYKIMSPKYMQILRNLKKMFEKADKDIQDRGWLFAVKDRIDQEDVKLQDYAELKERLKANISRLYNSAFNGGRTDELFDSQQELAFNVVSDIRGGKKHISVKLPPGYGKLEIIITLVELLRQSDKEEGKNRQIGFISGYKFLRDRIRDVFEDQIDEQIKILSTNDIKQGITADVIFVDSPIFSGEEDPYAALHEYEGQIILFDETGQEITQQGRFSFNDGETENASFYAVKYKATEYDTTRLFKNLLNNEPDDLRWLIGMLKEKNYRLVIHDDPTAFIEDYRSDLKRGLNVALSAGSGKYDHSMIGEPVQNVRSIMGLEYKNMYVIIGNELIFRDGLIQSHIPEEFHEMEKADKRVKMIYYVLFTRATENLHIYTADEPLREYLKELCG